MHIGKGQVVEIILEDGQRLVRVSCPPNLVPSPGQYLVAGDGSDAPLPVSLFYTDAAPRGFIATAPVSNSWNPGVELSLRGPLGRGFILPSSSRKIGLLAFDAAPARLKGLIQPALKQDAAIVLVSATVSDHLPDDVEVQPMSALRDVVEWADYVACDITRENLPQLREMKQFVIGKEVQVLIHTPLPCGGVAECGICAVPLKSSWKLACKDGPVFAWSEIDSKDS